MELTRQDLDNAVTWKHAFFGLLAMTSVALTHAAWAETHYADADDVTEIKQILVKCLIEKKC
jgi:hypothetical protein